MLKKNVMIALSLLAMAVSCGPTKTTPNGLKYEMLEHEIIPLKKDKINNLDIKIKCKSYLVAPVAENYFLGTIDIYSENNLITSTKILTSYKINRKGIFDYFNYFSKNYINILTNV